MDRIAQWKNDNPSILAEASKYAPKLTFTERCECLGLYKAGVIKQLIAATYGINVSTLGFIVQPQSPHYRNVRREYTDVGHDKFLEKYVTANVLERVTKASHDWKATIPAKDYDEVKAKFDTVTLTDPRAKRMEGRQTVFWLGAGTVYIAVTFVEVPIPPMPELNYDEAREPGWYVYVDRKSPGWQEWMVGEGPFGANDARKTSTSAYEAFCALIGHEFAPE